MSFLKTNIAYITVNDEEYNSLDDLGLAIENTDYIGDVVCNDNNQQSVPGRSGLLDFTDDVFGGAYYSYRPIKIIFGGLGASEEWDIRMANIRNKFQGKNVKVRFHTMPDWYFAGRAQINKLDRKRGLAKFEFDIPYADPYMYRVEETQKNIIATSSGITVACSNNRMPVIPLFITNGSCSVQFGTITKNIGEAGTHKFTDIVLKEGLNNLNVKGNNTNVCIKYREGSL